jgi:pectate lyase
MLFHRSINDSITRRQLNSLTSCGTGNPIDDCWRCDPNWESNRKRLADCGIGFGRNALGGRDGDYYVVTDSGDDDPVNPKLGTLRYAVIQDKPLWITFAHDMVITLKQASNVSFIIFPIIFFFCLFSNNLFKDLL